MERAKISNVKVCERVDERCLLLKGAAVAVKGDALMRRDSVFLHPEVDERSGHEPQPRARHEVVGVLGRLWAFGENHPASANHRTEEDDGAQGVPHSEAGVLGGGTHLHERVGAGASEGSGRHGAAEHDVD